MSADEVDELSSGRTRGVHAVEISELHDLIEVGNRGMKRMQWVELPLGMLLALFFLRSAVTYDGVPFIVLTILFSALLLRRIWQHRRTADHLSDLEERLEDGARLAEPREGLH